MSEIVRMPVSADTCTVLGYSVKADSPSWLGLDLAKARVRTQSTLGVVCFGKDAPFDLHLDAPWKHPDDSGPHDCVYRVRPKMEPGKRWRGRQVLGVEFDRPDGKGGEWVLVVTFAGQGRR